MQPPEILQPRVIARTVLTVLAVLAAVYVVYLLRKPIGYVVVATFIAITLSGPVNVLSRHMRRGAAIALTYVGVLMVPVLLALIVVPPMVREGTNLAEKAPEYANDVQEYVEKNKRLRELNDEYDITGKLEEEAAKLPGKVGDAAGTLGDIGVGLVNSAFALVNILILSVFLVASGRGWIDRFVEWRRPKDAARIKLVFDRIGRTFGNYIGGALLQATIAAVIAYIVMKILGVPFAAPLAVATFFFDLIPLVGATIGAVLVALVTLFTDFPTATIIWVIFAIIYQQVENTVIQPQIQKRAVNVHPFIVLVAVLFGSTLLGVLGALVAIPIAASVQIAIREWWTFRHDQTIQQIVEPAGPVDPPPPIEPAT
ncbi:MAG TPA: AI-2E family transporter, partial [Solirubrobacteraceae bacterium]